MYYDLHVPFPLPDDPLPKKGAKRNQKGKEKATGPAGSGGPDWSQPGAYWAELTAVEKDRLGRSTSMLGHLGYTVIGCTITSEPSHNVPGCPFTHHLPYPDLDPRKRPPGAKGGGRTLVQATRFHMRLDDAKTHCFSSSNATVLGTYDILSVQPMSEKAFQLACTDLSNPGPNQISIITLPLHERGFHYRLNRKQLRQAQRNGVVFELTYSPALFPNPSIPSDVAKRFRQNWMSNAREAIRATSGRGIVFSSGAAYGSEALRAPVDMISLGVILGMPANLAKEALDDSAKRVLLRAQARRTFKAVVSAPRLVSVPSAVDAPPTPPAKRPPDSEEATSKPLKPSKKAKN